MTERQGYRGYIASRPINGNRTPQHIQNMVIREYAKQNNLEFLLSATELSPKNAYMVLENVLREMPRLNGVICYSLFMLPERRDRRLDIYRRILDCGAERHAAVEGWIIKNRGQIERVEDIWQVREIIQTGLLTEDLHAAISNKNIIFQ